VAQPLAAKANTLLKINPILPTECSFAFILFFSSQGRFCRLSVGRRWQVFIRWRK
jgi:hypothetical protein